MERRVASWKASSMRHSKNSRLKSRKIKSLEASGDKLKEQLRLERSKTLRLEKALKELHLGECEQKGLKIARHSYDLETVWFCLLIKQCGSMSLRTCRAVVSILCIYFGLRVPSIHTIRNWEMKLGHYRLVQQGDKSCEYVLIIDESFNVGGQSMLLVLAVNLSTYEFGKALQFKDCQVVSIKIKRSWKAVDISEVVQEVRNKTP